MTRMGYREETGLSTLIMWDRLKSAMASRVMPVVTIHLGPNLVASTPATGAKMKTEMAIGRNVSPALNADNPLTVCRNIEMMNTAPNSPIATIVTVKRPYLKPLNLRRLKSKRGTLPLLSRRISQKVNPASRTRPLMSETNGRETRYEVSPDKAATPNSLA